MKYLKKSNWGEFWDIDTSMDSRSLVRKSHALLSKMHIGITSLKSDTGNGWIGKDRTSENEKTGDFCVG